MALGGVGEWICGLGVVGALGDAGAFVCCSRALAESFVNCVGVG